MTMHYKKLKYTECLVLASDILVVVLALSACDNGLDIFCLLFRSSLGAECAAAVLC